jgi:hypothetical protein
MVPAVVFGLPSNTPPDAAFLRYAERLMNSTEESIRGEARLAGCEGDGPCYAIVLFQTEGQLSTYHQFSCRSAMRFLEFGFPYLEKCSTDQKGEAYWGKMKIVHDPVTPGRYAYDSLLAVLAGPLALIFGGLALIFLRLLLGSESK